MTDETIRSLTPGLPLYREARHFLRILDAVPYPLYRTMYDAIREQRGSPKEQEDWTAPDDWIPERLSGSEQALALRIWRESNHELNPRYLRGTWYLATKHRLLDRGHDDILRVTGRGQEFLSDPQGAIVAEIDSYEGLLSILQLVAEHGPGRRSELLPHFTAFCQGFTSYRSETVIKGALYDRLVNLIERGYVVRRAQTYEISDHGLAYFETWARLIPGPPSGDKLTALRRLANTISGEARSRLAEYLAGMDPFKFQELVKRLLEEMDYTDVETSSPVNDKGVDVVANIELGISSVKEVIQVKRHKSNINRPVLDQLRGSLPRFGAVRGTIITTGGFSKGTTQAAFERGAAPITLVDGEKLLDLLIQYEIGVSKGSVGYVEFAPEKLAQFEPEEEVVHVQ